MEQEEKGGEEKKRKGRKEGMLRHCPSFSLHNSPPHTHTLTHQHRPTHKHTNTPRASSSPGRRRGTIKLES
ncbi:hypothetical protein E2C01_034258 [Portunus trituberculatus]|uniref:Uncharacterized protein n=1 Tax=Portunus trituberculatus TaxID=210409 RepID=A0A5B7F6L9_PORTR|nr:hypothetical protein [Portunus trituberculatus]